MKKSKDISYKVKSELICGSSFQEVWKKAQLSYKKIKSRTKRKPYVKCKFFKKEKIFFDYYWIHLSHKSPKIRLARLKLFDCAIELIEKTIKKPTIKTNPNKKSELLYRFYGIIRMNEKFVVQIKEDQKKQNKFLMSVYENRKPPL